MGLELRVEDNRVGEATGGQAGHLKDLDTNICFLKPSGRHTNTRLLSTAADTHHPSTGEAKEERTA